MRRRGPGSRPGRAICSNKRPYSQVQRLHQAVVDEKNSLHGNHSHLQELLSAEKKAKDEMQRRHTMVESDKMRLERGLFKVDFDAMVC